MPAPSPLFRYRAPVFRRWPLEPIDDPALIERFTVHSPNAEHARRAIAAVSGALMVGEVERLGEVLPAETGETLGAEDLHPGLPEMLASASGVVFA